MFSLSSFLTLITDVNRDPKVACNPPGRFPLVEAVLWQSLLVDCASSGFMMVVY
jgi:hypothetical protein